MPVNVNDEFTLTPNRLQPVMSLGRWLLSLSPPLGLPPFLLKVGVSIPNRGSGEKVA